MSRLTGPSSHLLWSELACKDGTPYPKNWRLTRALPLAEVFELIRAELSRRMGREVPISIRSAFRSKAHNDALRRRGYKASRKSQHLRGKALDLGVPVGVTPEMFRSTIRELAGMHAVIGGVGYYRTFVHIDIRVRPANGHLAVWNQVHADPERRAA